MTKSVKTYLHEPKETYKRDLRKRPCKKDFEKKRGKNGEKDPSKRPLKETCRRDVCGGYDW